MDIFDAANVVNVVYKNAAPKRLTLDITNQVTLVARSINPVIRVEQLHSEHRWILAAHGDRVRIRLRFFGWILVRIINDYTFKCAVVIQRNERASTFLSCTFSDEKCRAIIGWLRQTGIANSVVRGHGFPNAFQGDCAWNF